MKHAELVVPIQYRQEYLPEAVQIAKEHRYTDYFKFYRESDVPTPRGFQTWREYCQGASQEAARVMEIEQFRNDYRGLLPDEVLTAVEADLTEAKTHLFKEDVDYLQNRYYIPVQHGGVYYFRQHYNYFMCLPVVFSTGVNQCRHVNVSGFPHFLWGAQTPP